jgi:RND family efflux transporter MFP subunit
VSFEVLRIDFGRLAGEQPGAAGAAQGLGGGTITPDAVDRAARRASGSERGCHGPFHHLDGLTPTLYLRIDASMKVHRAFLVLAVLLAALPASAQPQPGPARFTARAEPIADEKATFATVESLNVVPARARIGGTVVARPVRNGDAVTLGQLLAVVGDPKLALQMGALDAQIAGAQSQLSQAQADLARADTLFRQGSGPRVALDQARTAAEVATSTLRARTAERDVLRQQMTEGEVLAPATGRVLDVPVTRGSVVLPGDTLATIAEHAYVLRLRVPERHAAFLKVGDPVRIDAAELGGLGTGSGRITLVYPRIEEGRVVADAEVTGLPDAFVGARIRVWIAAGARTGLVVPEAFLLTRFGLDTVRLQRDGGTIEVPVQRGQPHPTPVLPDGIEILSGLRAGDVLVQP